MKLTDIRALDGKTLAQWEETIRGRIYYKINRAHYALVTGNYLPKQKVANRALFQTGTATTYFVMYKDLWRIANEHGVAPDYLIDAEWYAEKRYCLPYKIAFALLEQGKDLWDLYAYLVEQTTYGYMKPRTFVEVCKGQWVGQAVRFDTILEMCKFAGLTPGEVIVTRGFSPISKELVKLTAGLNRADMAALVAMAEAMRRKDIESVRAVAEWWRAKQRLCFPGGDASENNRGRHSEGNTDISGWSGGDFEGSTSLDRGECPAQSPKGT